MSPCPRVIRETVHEDFGQPDRLWRTTPWTTLTNREFGCAPKLVSKLNK